MIFNHTTFAASNACERPPVSKSSCEIVEKVCSEARSEFERAYGRPATEDVYGKCPLDRAAEVGLSIKNCAIPGFLITSMLVKNIGIRAAGTVVGATLFADSMNEALKQDEKCYYDNDGKKKIITQVNSKVQYVENILKIELTDLKIIRTDEAISHLTCTELRNLVLQKGRSLDAVVGKNFKLFSKSSLEEYNDFEYANNELKEQGIRLSCLRPSKKALILCEIAAAGTGIGVLAASKLARQIAAAKNVGMDIKTSDVGKIASGSSKSEPALKSLTYSKKQLDLLDDLVARGLITKEEAKYIVETGDTNKIWRLFVKEEKLTMEELDNLLGAFKRIDVGRPIGPEKLIEFKPRRAANGMTSKILVQERQALDGSQSLALLDPASKQPIAFLEYTVKDGVFNVDFIRVQTRYQNFGYPEVLLGQAMKAHPSIKTVSAELAESNLATIEKALEKNIPIEEAVKKTPAYKSAVQLGFTKVKIKVTQNKRADGSVYNVYEFTAEKP